MTGRAMKLLAILALAGIDRHAGFAFNPAVTSRSSANIGASTSASPRRPPAARGIRRGDDTRRGTALHSRVEAPSGTRYGVRVLEGGEPAVLVDEDGDKKWNRCNEYVELGTSGLKVSKMGLGCIMFGGQMDQEQSHAVLNHAFDKAGINWLDTSETYPHPLYPEHKFKADPIIGSWLKGRDRSKVILSTKVAGRCRQCTWLRKDGDETRLTRDQILESVEGSLERLGTDYIDVLHVGDWPERKIVDYGNYYYKYSDEYSLSSDIEEQLMAVQELIEQGAVRHVAVANETPYGVTKFIEHHVWDDLPKIVSVQSPYNLLTQARVELGLLEACAPKQGNVGIVAVTPLAGGGLTGKYMDELKAFKNRKFRLNQFPGFQARFNSPRVWEVMEQYKAIAARYDLTLHQMALAFIHSRPFINASLVGATSPEQIDQNVGTLGIKLPDECLADIVHVQDDRIEPTVGPSEVELWYDYEDQLLVRDEDLVD